MERVKSRDKWPTTYLAESVGRGHFSEKVEWQEGTSLEICLIYLKTRGAF